MLIHVLQAVLGVAKLGQVDQCTYQQFNIVFCDENVLDRPNGPRFTIWGGNDFVVFDFISGLKNGLVTGYEFFGFFFRVKLVIVFPDHLISS